VRKPSPIQPCDCQQYPETDFLQKVKQEIRDPRGSAIESAVSRTEREVKRKRVASPAIGWIGWMRIIDPQNRAGLREAN
jgi:hypothetical protein